MPKRWNKAPDPKLYHAAVRETFNALCKLRGLKRTTSKVISAVSTDEMQSRCMVWASHTIENIFAKVQFVGSTDDRPIAVTARIAASGIGVGVSDSYPPDTDVAEAARATLKAALDKLTEG